MLILAPFIFKEYSRNGPGVTPKQFQQYLSIAHAKEILRGPGTTGTTLFDAAEETGFSSTSRLPTFL